MRLNIDAVMYLNELANRPYMFASRLNGPKQYRYYQLRKLVAMGYVSTKGKRPVRYIITDTGREYINDIVGVLYADATARRADPKGHDKPLEVRYHIS